MTARAWSSPNSRTDAPSRDWTHKLADSHLYCILTNSCSEPKEQKGRNSYRVTPLSCPKWLNPLEAEADLRFDDTARKRVGALRKRSVWRAHTLRGRYAALRWYDIDGADGLRAKRN